jgi:hypothetical protein
VQNVATQRLAPVGLVPGLSDERSAQVLTTAVKLMRYLPRLRRR